MNFTLEEIENALIVEGYSKKEAFKIIEELRLEQEKELDKTLKSLIKSGEVYIQGYDENGEALYALTEKGLKNAK